MHEPTRTPRSPDVQALIDQLARPLDQLPDPLPIPTLAQAGVTTFHATITPPGSKSLTNRALLLALLADGTSTLTDPLTEADDAKRMLAAIDLLGGKATQTSSTHTLQITGTNATLHPPTDPVFLNNAGTATRFLAAASIICDHPLTIDGNARMRERPIAELADALTQLAVTHTYHETPGCPPITLTPPTNLPDAPTVTFDHLPSSQFVSGLLLVAPFLPTGLTLIINTQPTSKPYIQMTLDLLTRLGAQVTASRDLRHLTVKPAKHRARGLDAFDLTIEPDASGATYWHTAAAITPGASITIPGLNNSLQGDAHYPSLLEQMGAKVTRDTNTTTTTGPAQLRAIHADMAPMPDAAMSLAAAAAFANGTTTMTGLETLRVKETDRIAAMHTELTKLAMHIETNAGGDPGAMTFTPTSGTGVPPVNPPASTTEPPPIHFDTYEDHRMAMSLALIALHRPNVFINDPQCVAKTYPTFFQDLARLYATGD